MRWLVSCYTENENIVESATKMATLKVILLGSCNVGKTSIINKYVKGVFYEKPATTVGVDFAMKPITRDELKTRSASTCSDFASH
jgi:GTPase SAR1 family protein